MVIENVFDVFLREDVKRLEFNAHPCHDGLRVDVTCAVVGIAKPFRRWFNIELDYDKKDFDLCVEMLLDGLIEDAMAIRKSDFCAYATNYLNSKYGKTPRNPKASTDVGKNRRC